MKTEIKVRNIKNEEQIYNFLKRNCKRLGRHYICLEDEHCDDPILEYFKDDPDDLNFAFQTYSIEILNRHDGYYCHWYGSDDYYGLKSIAKSIFKVIQRDYTYLKKVKNKKKGNNEK